MGCGASSAAVPNSAHVVSVEPAKHKQPEPVLELAPVKEEAPKVMPGGPLFQPTKVGTLSIRNRFVMAPMTRQRATLTHVPLPIMAKYYGQRAPHAGLIISESTVITHDASCVFATPGLYNEEQIAGWKAVTAAVHASGSVIFAQLVHFGRTSHQMNGDNQDDISQNAMPVAPSAIAITAHGIRESGNRQQVKLKYQMPRELEEEEIPKIIDMYVAAAKNAIAAGFDGVELHGGTGYLIDQFWRASANKRPAGRYAGTNFETRSQFAIDVAAAVAKAVGAGVVGIRISPLNSFNEMSDPDPEALTRYLCGKLREIGIAYVHVVRGDALGVQKGDALKWAREAFKGFIIGNMGYTPEEAQDAIRNGEVDAIAFAKLFLANPDLPVRVLRQAELNAPDMSKAYGVGDENEAGYTDYPELILE